MGQLETRAVVVNGASELGRAAARRCVREGARVALIATGAAGEVDTAISGVHVIHADSRRAGGIARAVEESIALLGPVDALVNAIHPINAWKPFMEKAAADFDSVLGGLRATLDAMRAAYPVLKQTQGRVVNVGSVFGASSFAHVSDSVMGDYGLQGLTRAVGVEWAQHGVLVNYLGPGALDVPEFRRWRAQHPAAIDKRIHSLALQRLGDVDEDFGGALMFLLSDEACFLVGHTVYVDGGQHLVAPVFEPGAPL